MKALSRLVPDEAALAARLLEGFRALSTDPAGGVTRPAWSEVESACHALLAEAGEAHGLTRHVDAVGNLWLSPPGLGEAACMATGSHLDSVPQGGNYDGAAGSVAGLLCALRALREGWPLRAVVLRGEESPWFGAPYVGTRAAFGALQPAELNTKRRDSGLTLAQHLRALGFSPEAAGSGAPLPEVQRVTMFWELHIEQGPVLLDRDLPAAAVSAVRGHIRHSRARCIGEAGHSGVVPRHLRRDPAMAVAELMMDLDGLWARSQQEGADLVVTAGMLATEREASAPTRIPGEVTFSLDIRSADAAVLEGMRGFLARRCADIGRARGVAFELGPRAEAAPIVLDAAGQAAIEAALARPYVTVSGAGHDAAEFARRGTPAAMVFVRNANGSHNPREAMEIGDLMVGVEAMYAAMRARLGLAA